MFFADMKSGLEDAAVKVKYIHQATEWWLKYGANTAKPSGIDAAASDLNKISTSVGGQIAKYVKYAQRAKEVVQFLQAAADVGEKARAWKDPRDLDALEDAITSVR